MNVRIDRYLQHTNLFSKRSDAKEFLDMGKVRINDKIAKPSTSVKNNDIIILYMDDKIIKLSAKIEIDGRIIYVGFDVIETIKRDLISC